VLRPPEQLSEPYQTVRGQVIFEHDDCRRLLAALAERPRSWSELCSALPCDIPTVQRRLLGRIHDARMGFRGADGKAAPDELAALQRELARLEATFIPPMG